MVDGWINFRRKMSEEHSFSVNPQTSDIRGTSVDNEIVDHSDVVGASHVGAAPTASSFSTEHKTTARRDKKHLSFGIWCDLYSRFDSLCLFCYFLPAYMCHHNSFLIYDSLVEPSEKRWGLVTHSSVLFAMACTLILGITGYATFTGHTQGKEAG